MKKENNKEFLEVPVFVSLGERPYGGIDPVEVKKPPRLTRGKVILTSLLVLLVSVLVFWLI